MFLADMEAPVRDILLKIVPEELARWDPYLHTVLLAAGEMLRTGEKSTNYAENLDPRDAYAATAIFYFVNNKYAQIAGMRVNTGMDIEGSKNTILNYVAECNGRYQQQVDAPAPNLEDTALAKAIVDFYQNRAAQTLQTLS